MPGAVIVLPSTASAARRELAAWIAGELIAQGVPAPVRDAPPPSTGRGEVVISVGLREQLRLEGPGAVGDRSALSRMIVIADDSAGALTDGEYVELLGLAGAVFAGDELTAARYRRRGVAAQVLRLGHMPSRDRFDPAADRPIELVWLGESTPRRRAWLSAAEPVTARHRSRGWGEGAAAPLAEAMIAVNLHPEDGDPRLRWQDVLPAIHAGAVVVSEHATGLEPLIAGTHLLLAAPDSLAYVAEGLLDDPERLARLRRAAHARIAGWLPFALSVSSLRIAIARLAGAPVLG